MPKAANGFIPMSAIFTVKSFPSFDGRTLRYGLIQSDAAETDRTPIVFVPGLGGSIKFAIDFLEQFVPHHGPVFGMDARGFGLNEQTAPQPRPGDYLKDFERFMAHLQESGQIRPDQQPLLFGLSLGGVFSTLYLTQYQNPFKGLTLLAPAFAPHPSLFDLKFRLKTYGGILTKGTGAMTTMPYGVQEITRNAHLYDDPNFSDPLVLPSFYLYFVDRMCRKALKKTPEIQVPSAIVVPENDYICDPATMKRAYEQIGHPQKTLLTYPGVYHDVAVEPEADRRIITTDLSQWISGLPFSQETPAS